MKFIVIITDYVNKAKRYTEEHNIHRSSCIIATELGDIRGVEIDRVIVLAKSKAIKQLEKDANCDILNFLVMYNNYEVTGKEYNNYEMNVQTVN